jgi:predicted alpha/beta superfamily hydrolase
MSSIAWTLVTAAIVLGAIDPAQAGQQPVPVTGPGVTGTVLRYPSMSSQHVAARNVDIWLPPGYDRESGKRYPVLYMHDGQNLFDPATSYGGVDWGIDETMTTMVAAGEVREAIVVGVWNTSKRREEYMPQRAVQGVAQGAIDFNVPGSTAARQQDIISDRYLAFLVDELKPFIDANYRTLPDRADTLIMGSSMGGLVSQYAISKYPDVYGGAGCVSTHWPAGDGIALDDFAAHLPDPATHKYYFDYGTATLDETYEPYQRRADEILRKAGYVEGRNWITRKFDGAEHSEKAWRLRVGEPLAFLIGR